MRVAIMLAPELEAARMREALRGAVVALDRDYAGLVAAKDAIRRLQGERERLREALARLVQHPESPHLKAAPVGCLCRWCCARALLAESRRAP